MLYNTIRWTTTVMLMYFNLLLIFPSDSAFQCSRAYSYKVCVRNRELSLNHKIHEKNLSDVDYHYDGIICSCAFEAERAGYEHFVIRERYKQTIVCYAVNYNPQSSRRNKISAVVDELNDLLAQSECPQRCDKHGGCIRLGTGDYSTVYHVTPTKITLTSTPETTVRTEILSPSTTHKPFWRPPPPQLWEKSKRRTRLVKSKKK